MYSSSYSPSARMYARSEKGKIARKRTHQKLRRLCMEEYCGGVAHCMCIGCPITALHLLDFDHVRGGGNKHRKQISGGVGFWCWLKRNNYPSGYQVLCCNCHRSKTVKQSCQHGRIP